MEQTSFFSRFLPTKKVQQVQNIVEDKEIKEVERKIPQGAIIDKKIMRTQLYRIQLDIMRWRSAINVAESILRPERVELVRIYRDILLDAHLYSLYQSRKNNVLGADFSIVNSKGDILEAETKLFHKEWFSKFMDYSLDSIFYGYEVIQFGDIVDGCFSKVEKIREEYVTPAYSVVKNNLYIVNYDTAVHYLDAPYNKWVIGVGENFDLGLLCKAAPLALWKKNVLGNWSTLTEVFGMPVRIGRTDIYDEQRRGNMLKMLETMGSCSYGVFDSADAIEMVEAGGKTGSADIYDRLIERANTELSKLIVGQTMTMDAGSSYSQSEVHERTQGQITIADKRYIANVVENQLLPIMRFHNLIGEDTYFKFDSSEKIYALEYADIISKLAGEFNFDDAEVSAKLGLKLTQKISAQPKEETKF